MSSVLCAGEVIQGVITSVVDEGPVAPTARRLAARLHVAPATLYSAFPAMADAYAGAKSTLVHEVQKPLLDALARAESEPLLDWILASPSRALFVTDPAWDLELNPMLAHALLRVGFDHRGICDVLAAIGSTFTISAFDESRLNVDRLDEVIELYKSQMEAPVASPTGVEISAADVDEVVDGVERRMADSDDVPSVIAARVASARLMTHSEEPEWSFRELGRMTDIPVTRLHRYGSRLQHLELAGAPLLHALRGWAGKSTASQAERDARFVAFLVQTGAAANFVELYRECRLRPAGPSVPDFDDVFGSELEPQIVAVIAAGQRSGREPADVVDLTSRLMTKAAA